MSVDSDSDQSFGDWTENESSSVKCLFCEKLYDDVLVAIAHCAKDHSFDFSLAKRKYNMDFYSYIKCINFTRTQIQEDEHFDPSTLFEVDSQPWNDDRYLIPFIKDDPWLMIGKKYVLTYLFLKLYFLFVLN